MHELRTTRELELVVAAGPAADALADSVARLETRGRWRVVARQPADAQAQPGDGARRSRCVVADADTPGVAELLDALGRTARFVDSSLELGPALAERARAEPGLVLLATFADPARPGLPVTLALGHTALEAALVLGDVTPCAEPSWQLFVAGEFSRGGLLWRPPRGSPPPQVEVESQRTAELTGARELARERFDVRAALSVEEARLEDALVDWERALARLDKSLLLAGEGAPARPVVFAHATVDAQLALTGRGQLARANPLGGALHALVAAGIPDDGGAALASLVAREALGPPDAAWLERAVGLEAASSWYGQSLGRWLAHLARAGLVPAPAQLVDPSSDLSPHVLEPARAGLVRFLLAQRGRDELRALWRGERRLALDGELEADFARWLDFVRKSHDADLADWRQRRSVLAHKRPFRRGVSLVAPPFDRRVGSVGFGSAAYLTSVATARAVGADAAALVFPVYAERGLPSQAGGGSRWVSADASDLELLVGARRAKELGLHVMLRPRLLASPTSSLAGWSLVATPGGWDAFFAAQRRVGVHYGLLAELAGAELFCLAGEIANASVTKPTRYNVWERDALEQRAAEWRGVISTTRAAFTGGLTFAAETLYEAESIEFWGQLDFIGVDLMAEVVQDGLGEEFSRERVVRSIAGLLGSYAELSALERRPLLITEFGFSSTAQGWKLAAFPQGEYDGDMQARLYEAWGEALARTPRVRRPQGGAYLWSWSTDPGAGGPEQRGFTPQAKPAERVLQGLFRQP